MASPILVRRTAGQSVRDQKERLTDDWLVPACFTLTFVWVLWILELFKKATHQPPQPTIAFVVAISVTGFVGLTFRRLIPKFRNLNRGERGELKVGELLDELRQFGYRSYHGLRRGNFDIDHVVVGPAGVFAIETKYRSGSGQIEFRNGEGLFVGGRQEEKDALKQARSNAREVNQMISEHCGVYQWVKPLVVFVGNWTVKNRWTNTDTRVLTANHLVSYFESLQPELTRQRIQLITSHFERTARN